MNKIIIIIIAALALSVASTAAAAPHPSPLSKGSADRLTQLVMANARKGDEAGVRGALGAALVVGYLAGHTMADCERLPQRGLHNASCQQVRRDLPELARPLGVKRLGTAVP